MNTHPTRALEKNLVEEVERIRALLMNLHGLLQGSDAAHRAEQPIESIHRALDRIAKTVAPKFDS